MPMVKINGLGRAQMNFGISNWWKETFYKESIQDLTDTLNLVKEIIVNTGCISPKAR